MGQFQDGGRRLERRRNPRFAYRANLQMEWGSALLSGRTRDISEGGLYIEADDVLWVGAGFRARLELEESLYLDCFVRRVEPGRGMGVAIKVNDGPDSARFSALLERLANPAG